MVQVDASTKLPDLRPVRSGPPLYHFYGFGLYLYGERDFDLETESFVRTLCFCLMYIPVFALRAYRVVPTDDGWRYLGRVPVSDSVRLLSAFVSIAILVGSGYLGTNLYLNSPGYLASQKMAEADRLAAEGHIGDAAKLLADVAVGPTALDRPAAQQLAKLLDNAAAKSDPAGLGVAFRAAMGVQKAGRWQGSAKRLHDSGVALAKETAAKDPAGTWAILDAVAPLAPQDQAEATFRHELLEKVVAADPSNVDWASRLAADYESKGELERCEKILTPLRARLGELEGARILGLVDVRADRLDQAIPLLRTYTKNRLKRLSLAETRLRSLYSDAEKRIFGQLKDQRVSDFPYDLYRDAGPTDQEKLLNDYFERKVKGDVAIARAKEELIAESSVVPAAMELGMILLQHAQAQADPQARKALLNEAENTFLAVSRMAGDQAEYQFSLAQVYYWQGKHAEGRKLFDDVLKARNRDPALLLEVATLLRGIGSKSDARTLAEEGFNKATDSRIKDNCAVLRGLLSDDVEETILWLRRANSNDPPVKALLGGSLADQALNKGDEALAISNLKQVVAIYKAMPESPASLNNSSNALMTLAHLTGDSAAYERAGTLIARAAALDPGNSLTLSNASARLLEAGLRNIIGNQIDLKMIKDRARVELLNFLVKDESERQTLSARLRSHSVVNRALSLMEKVILLAPRNSSSYQAGMPVLVYRDDLEGLRRTRTRLQGITLDLDDETKKTQEIHAGKRDKEMQELVRAALAKSEPILPVARAKGGPTFAATASRVLQSRMNAPSFGIAVDRDAIVTLAEEAFATAPSLASRWYLCRALLFRATDRLARANPSFAALRNRSVRSVSSEELIGSVLSTAGPLKELALKDPDVSRAIDILRESYAASPSYSTDPNFWILLRDKHPDIAATMAKSYLTDNPERLKDELRAELQPFDPSVSLKAYWTACMRNNESEGLRILDRARSRGVPIPIGSP